MTQRVFTAHGNDTLDASSEGINDIAVFRNLGDGDVAIGGAGNDRFAGNGNGAAMYGGSGDDQFFEVLNRTVGGERDTIDGGTGSDELIIAINSDVLTAASKAELGRLNDYITAGNFGDHFVSDILHIDMVHVEKALLRVDGVLESVAAVAPITFEGLGNNAPIADGYRGFDWHASPDHLFTLDSNTLPNSGYAAGSIPPDHTVAYNPYAEVPIDISRHGGGTFNFDKVSVTAAWDTSLDVTFQGMKGGKVVGQETVTVNDHGPTLVTANWGAIDDLHITSANGVHDPMASGGGDHIVFDNFFLI